MVHWFNQSAGPLLLLLHGFTGDVHSWDDVVAHLPQQGAVAALPLPGHHPQVPAQATFEASCDAIAAQIQALNAAAVHLVGYSLGARLALGIIVRHPQLARQVSLLGGHIGLEQESELRERSAADAKWLALLETKGIDAFVHAWEAHPIFASQRDLPLSVRLLQHRRRASHDSLALAASLRSTGLAEMPNYWPKLGTISVPVRFLVGGRDAKFLALARRAHAQMPNSSLLVFEQCGHNVILEAPARLAESIGGGPC